MIPEQREVLDEIITKIRAGRLTRRSFLERAVAVGLSSSAAVSLLEACGGSTTSTGSGTTTIILQTAITRRTKMAFMWSGTMAHPTLVAC